MLESDDFPSAALLVLELMLVFLACFSLSVSQTAEIAEGGASDWTTVVDLTGISMTRLSHLFRWQNQIFAGKHYLNCEQVDGL